MKADPAEVTRRWCDVKAMLDGGDMKMATATIGDHVCAVIVYGVTQKEADERAAKIADAWNLAYARTQS